MLDMLRMFGAILLVPALVSVIAGEFIHTLIFAALGGGSYLAGKFIKNKNVGEATIKEALVATALSYLMFSLLSALAFLPVASYLDGFFESVSGYTTTGLSVMNVEKLPNTLLFFRSYMHWIGGAGIVIISLVTLIGAGKTAFKLYTTEFGEENLAADVQATARLVLKVYLSLTGIGYLAYLVSGMGFFDALIHIMATVSTGGFSSHPDSIGHYGGTAVNLTVIFFMFTGAIGFPCYYLAIRGQWKKALKDVQLVTLLILIVAFSVIFIAISGWESARNLSSLFFSATAATTTGFSTQNVSQMSDAIKFLFIFLMIAGGSGGSTAGGIKLTRLLIALRTVQQMVVRSLLPDETKLPLKFRDQVIDDRQTHQIFGFIGIYLLLFFVTAGALVFSGYGVADSLFESASALGTVGLSAGITSEQLPGWIKLLLSFNMWAGRLEILPVLLVFYPTIWIPKRREK